MRAMRTGKEKISKGKLTEIRKLGAVRRFGIYKEEKISAIRTPEIKRSEALESIRCAWESFSVNNPLLVGKCYPLVFPLIKEIPYSSKNVERFSIMLADFSEEWRFSFKAGLFLSTLMNNCKDSEFVIHTRHLTPSIDFLGLENSKTIVVEGNAGVGLGLQMKGGSILVKGGAGARAGAAMEGGCIIIKGNVAEEVGDSMEGGVIRVEGNAGNWPGKAMKGGEIHISKRISRRVIGMSGGKIYHKSKLIHPREGENENP